MTLAQIQSRIYRRTKTNANNFLAADQVIALNNANEYAHSLIRDYTDNYSPTSWTTTDLSTGTATPVFDSLYHQIIPAHVEMSWLNENASEKAPAAERELLRLSESLVAFYASRRYRITTVTIASPGVFTRPNHGFRLGDRVILSTSGALPTGLSANTWYYITSANLDDDNFCVSATRGGTAINTSGSQSGTHWVASDSASQAGFVNSNESNR